MASNGICVDVVWASAVVLIGNTKQAKSEKKLVAIALVKYLGCFSTHSYL